jgi:hypothetical protein
MHIGSYALALACISFEMDQISFRIPLQKGPNFEREKIREIQAKAGLRGASPDYNLIPDLAARELARKHAAFCYLCSCRSQHANGVMLSLWGE